MVFYRHGAGLQDQARYSGVPKIVGQSIRDVPRGTHRVDCDSWEFRSLGVFGRTCRLLARLFARYMICSTWNTRSHGERARRSILGFRFVAGPTFCLGRSHVGSVMTLICVHFLVRAPLLLIRFLLAVDNLDSPAFVALCEVRRRIKRIIPTYDLIWLNSRVYLVGWGEWRKEFSHFY